MIADRIGRHSVLLPLLIFHTLKINIKNIEFYLEGLLHEIGLITLIKFLTWWFARWKKGLYYSPSDPLKALYATLLPIKKKSDKNIKSDKIILSNCARQRLEVPRLLLRMCCCYLDLNHNCLNLEVGELHRDCIFFCPFPTICSRLSPRI